MTRPRQLRDLGEEVAVADRRAKVWKMLSEFKSPDTIAKELGIPRNTVYKDKTHVLREVHEETGESVNTWRNELTGQLQSILERWGPLATAEDLVVEGEKINKKGEREIITLDSWDAGTKAAAIVLNTIREIAKIQGVGSSDGIGGEQPKKKLVLNVNIMQSLKELTKQPTKAEVIESHLDESKPIN